MRYSYQWAGWSTTNQGASMNSTEQYLQHLARRNLRPTYIYAQTGTLRRLAAFLAPDDVLGATRDSLTAYLDSRPHSPGTRATEIAHIRGFYGWALDTELIVLDPSRRLVKPKARRRLPRPMPDPDIAKALHRAPPRVRAILSLAFYAGLRSCEIAQLRAEDLHGGVIVINESKGGGMSSVPLSPVLTAILMQCGLPHSGWLFPGRNGHVTRMRIGQMANGHLHYEGITHTLHSLRHAYGTHVHALTGDLRVTQEAMRHSSPATTALYTFISRTEIAAAVAGVSIAAS